MNLIASYTKSGGSWLHWILIDWIHSPGKLLDLEEKRILDGYIRKTELIIPNTRPDVHLIRHPLDICCSLYNYFLLTNRATEEDKKELLDKFVGGQPSMAFDRSYFEFMEWGMTAPIIIRYEDLNRDPEKALIEIQQVNPNKSIKPSIEKYSLDKVRSREGKVKFVRPTNKKYSFFNKAASFYYQEILSEKQIEIGLKTYEKFIKLYWPETL